ncbi:hypothetical protein [Sphingomonas phage Kimi]|nr:hypothetical protein [Sphingomonas phage Kimi]
MSSKKDDPIKPQFRHGINLKGEILNEALKGTTWNVLGIMRSCIACDHFLEQTEQCTKYGARPPARVIAFGCPSFEDDNDIPF